MNNTERESFVKNDLGLSAWWKASRLSITDFVEEQRDSIDKILRIEKAAAKIMYRRYFLCGNCSTGWNNSSACLCSEECPECGNDMEPYGWERE